MSVRIVKNSGNYFLVGENIFIDITDVIEKEIKSRDEFNRKILSAYEQEELKCNSKLAIVNLRLKTSQSYLEKLLTLTEKLVDGFFKGKNIHGLMIVLKQDAIIIRKWLNQQ